MASLRGFLIEKGYTHARLFPTLTKHLDITAKINDVKRSFILSTGASNSFINFKFATHFKLTSEESEVFATGANATDIRTELPKESNIKIGAYQRYNMSLVLFDLSHVNTTIKNHKTLAVHGILGTDILNLVKSIIEYQYNYLYLKKYSVKTELLN